VTPAVELEHVSKRFRKLVLRSGYTTLKSALTGFSRRSAAPPEYVNAITDVSLSVPEGSTVGLVGPNGSGKSTLIRIIAGIYRADAGRVVTRGRVSALIELGAGFHPEFTGRENVYINGLILGLTVREVRQRFDEIVRFANLEEFIDTPLRTYSTGMYMRLGFSVAVHVDPDVLLVDEVLAVGDEAFVRKCLAKMDEFRRQGKTIVMATHDLAMVEHRCDAAFFLHHGQVAAHGDPQSVVAEYRRALAKNEGA
jgi:ABC-type polysaccharide/polyol phosphate transport system ATPase subunit